jgi:TfoX N-terminal domain
MTGHLTEVEAFYELRRRELLDDPTVTEKRMFGTVALFVSGKVFMLPWKGNLVLKLPPERVQAIVDGKRGEYFDPGHGRTSKTWVAVYPSAKREWPPLAADARLFVGSSKEK